MFETLDVGCGGFPRGNVNCDQFWGESPHTKYEIDSRKNFVKCDAHYLPFRDSTFRVVYGFHVIEHLKNPLGAIKEFSRVSRDYVYIKVPNTVTLFSQQVTHIFGWDAETLRNFLSLVFPWVKVYNSFHAPPLHGRILDRFFHLQRLATFAVKKLIPSELTAMCGKRRRLPSP